MAGLRTLLLALVAAMPLLARGEAPAWEIKGGRFYDHGQWRFLKVGKPLRNFADAGSCRQLIGQLDTLKAKHYDALELNCYWHHFDQDGDGVPDGSLAPLNELIAAIGQHGMIPCLSVETYAVGGGNVPPGFWKQHPDATAIDSNGNKVRDDEYGFNSAVPSIFSAEYRATARTFIVSLAKGVDTSKLLYFETTVEPQYMGARNLDYSPHAQRELELWKKANGLAAPTWPAAFPVPAAFQEDAAWNRFRAEFLADWVNGDAAAWRSVAGAKAYVAVDYLETDDATMRNRNGDSLTFLRRLSAPNVIQVNWHWSNSTHAPNLKAYTNVRQVMRDTGRDWAITEHMTINGSDYPAAQVPAMLENTLAQGTRFGWEFVDVGNSTAGSFSLYNDDWSPKPPMAAIDGRWDEWMGKVRAAGTIAIPGK